MSEYVYLAARYGAKEQVEAIANAIREHGHHVVSQWHTPGKMTGSYATATEKELLQEAEIDMSDMQLCTAFIILEHLGNEGSRGGRHFEFGYCAALGRPCAVTADGQTVLNLYQRTADQLERPFVENIMAWLDQLEAKTWLLG